MTTAVLLCLAVLSADNPATVRAEVLYGTGPDQQHRADIELWISQEVAKAGSPLAQPYTDWIALTGDDQRLYTSKQGGFTIDGKASERNDEHTVEINACEGVAFQKKVTLRPGERRVVNLTDNPAPNNVFIALEAPLSEMAMARAGRLGAGVKDFHLQLDCNGQEDKPFYRVILSVPPIGYDRSSPFYRLVQIREAQAIKIIDHLAAEGFLDKAADLRVKVQRPPCTMPGYTLTVTAEEVALREDLGWGLPMLRRLDGLRKVVEGDAAKEMDLLLGRLSGLRGQWEKSATQPDFSKLKEGITLSQARAILASSGRLRENSIPEEAIYDFDFDEKSAVLIVDDRATPAIVTKVIIWNHGKTVQEVRAQRRKSWSEWVEAHSPKERTKASMKGWELYIWQDGGETYFSLMVGTNRLKADEEIAQAAVKRLDAIKPNLDELKQGQLVFLRGRRLNENAPDEPAEMVGGYCRKIGLRVQP